MADRSSLGFVGMIFGGVTVAVVLTAATVVFGHVGGHWAIDSSSPAAVTTTLR